jgi:selenocysteine lyase/cysteine desulfurase
MLRARCFASIPAAAIRRCFSVLPCQNELFQIPAEICYLNAAYMGPSLRSTATKWATGVAAKSQPWELTKDDFYEDSELLRRTYGELIRCSADDVAIQSSSSYGAATAAANVRVSPGQNIVTLGGEHTSNRFIWQQLAEERGLELRVVSPPDPSQPAAAWTEAVLALIDSATAVTAVVPNYWMDGATLDLPAVSQRCREVGSALVVDGTQSVGVVDFDVQEIKPDFLFVALYKWMLCPYRLSLLYADPQYHDHGVPIEQHGWGDRDASTGRATAMWGIAGAEDEKGRLNMAMDPTARRFDMGERSDFSCLAAASDAIGQLCEWQRWEGASGGGTVAALQPMVRAISEEARSRGWTVPADPSPHMIGLRAPGGWPSDLAPKLWAQHSVHVSVRGPCLRVSPHVYNRVDEVAVLFDALDRVL